MYQWLSGTCLAVYLTLCSGTALAHEIDRPEACFAALTDQQVAQQLALVKDSLRAQRLHAALWWSGWNAFNVFNLSFGFYKYATAETRLAADSWLVSSIGAGIFVAATSILPLPGMFAHRKLERMPEDTPEQRRHKLERATYWLERAAAIEDTNSNWAAHLIGALYATVSTAYVWIRNRNADSHELTLAVTLQFTTSLAVAELTFFTAPTRARRDVPRLYSSTCALAGTSARGPARVPEPSLKLGFGAGQVFLSGRF